MEGARATAVWTVLSRGLEARAARRGLRAALCLGGMLGLLLGAVAASVYATTPARFRIATKNWTPRDWETHLEDAISRPGVAPEELAGIHKALGQWYAPAEPRAALEHYRKAAAFPSHSAEFRCDLGNAFFGLGHLDEAVEQCEKALELEPRWAEGHNDLGAVLAGRGELDAAMAITSKPWRSSPTTPRPTSISALP